MNLCDKCKCNGNCERKTILKNTIKSKELHNYNCKNCF